MNANAVIHYQICYAQMDSMESSTSCTVPAGAGLTGQIGREVLI